MTIAPHDTRLDLATAWSKAHAARRVSNAALLRIGDMCIVRDRATLHGEEHVYDRCIVDFGLTGDLVGTIVDIGQSITDGPIARVEVEGVKQYVDTECLTLLDAGRLPLAEAEAEAWRGVRDAEERRQREIIAHLRTSYGAQK